MSATLPDAVLVDVLDLLDAADEARVLDAALVRARVYDAILASMSAPQRRLMERWHSYVCPKCKHTMIANLRRDRDCDEGLHL